MTDLIDYGETVAAISAEIHGSEYNQIFANCADQVGGSAGILNFCAIAAQAFMAEEAFHNPGEDFYWAEAVEDFGDKLVGFLSAGDVLDKPTMQEIAAAAIRRNWID